MMELGKQILDRLHDDEYPLSDPPYEIQALYKERNDTIQQFSMIFGLFYRNIAQNLHSLRANKSANLIVDLSNIIWIGVTGARKEQGNVRREWMDYLSDKKSKDSDYIKPLLHDFALGVCSRTDGKPIIRLDNAFLVRLMSLLLNFVSIMTKREGVMADFEINDEYQAMIDACNSLCPNYLADRFDEVYGYVDKGIDCREELTRFLNRGDVKEPQLEDYVLEDIGVEL